MSRQIPLFPGDGAGIGRPGPGRPDESGLWTVALSPNQLSKWLERIATYQHPLLQGRTPVPLQMGLLEDAARGDVMRFAEEFDPLTLVPMHLQFWRWPLPSYEGPAVYVVMDQPGDLNLPLLLYVGETSRAGRRWKGDHDCKAYLSAYGEALVRARMSHHPTIRFWSDVPAATAPRRALEQALIRRWLPPFNKEARARWNTPFQAEPH